MNHVSAQRSPVCLHVCKCPLPMGIAWTSWMSYQQDLQAVWKDFTSELPPSMSWVASLMFAHIHAHACTCMYMRNAESSGKHNVCFSIVGAWWVCSNIKCNWDRYWFAVRDQDQYNYFTDFSFSWKSTLRFNGGHLVYYETSIIDPPISLPNLWIIAPPNAITLSPICLPAIRGPYNTIIHPPIGLPDMNLWIIAPPNAITLSPICLPAMRGPYNTIIHPPIGLPDIIICNNEPIELLN